MKENLKDFYEMIDEVDVAMLTTRRSDGYLVSRPMAMQDRVEGADLWFVTSDDTEKLDEVLNDPHINLSWYNARTKEWISVAGTAHLTKDKDTIEKLYDKSWKVYFPGDDEDSGTPRDPRITLLGVEVHSAVYMEVHKPAPVVLYEIVKGFVSGKTPEIGEVKRIRPQDIE